MWNIVERFFKRKQLRFMESVLGKKELSVQDFKADTVHKILIIRQHDQLGDFLLSTPVFRALRNKFPDAHITVVARKYTTALAQYNQYINQIICFYEHGRDWSPGRLWSFLKELRNNYDLVIVLNTVSHSLTSDLLAVFSGARYVLGSEHKLFKGTSRNYMYNLIAPYYTEQRHQSQRNVDIVAYIGAQTDDLTENMTLQREEIAWAREQLMQLGWGSHQKIVAVHPGAGKMGNRWPVKNFAAAASEIARRHNAKLFLTWGPNEEELGRELCSLVTMPYITAVNSDIRLIAALLSYASLFLCNDTGVLHLSAAVGTPLIVVFGPTDPEQWKPIGEHFLAVRGNNNDCSQVFPETIINLADKLLM